MKIIKTICVAVFMFILIGLIDDIYANNVDPQLQSKAGNNDYNSDNTTGGDMLTMEIIDDNGIMTDETVDMSEKSPVILGETAPTLLEAYVYTDSDIDAGGLFIGKARGTEASPTTVQEGDRLGWMLGRGYDGTSWLNPAGFTVKVDGAVSTGSVPARISLETGSSYATRQERLVIKNDGSVGIGTTDPKQGLHVVINNENTSSTERVATFYHTTSGTAQDGIGAWIGIGAETETGLAKEGRIQYKLLDVTENFEEGLMEFQTHDDSSFGTRLAINGSNVGIGTTSPSYKLQVNGEAAGTSWTNLSSREYKENIKKVDSSKHDEMLSQLMKVNLTTYNYKEEYGDDHSTKLGFIAEEMPKDVLSKDGKGIDVYELLTCTIGAMKAQQEMIQSQQKQIEELNIRISEL